MKRVLRNASLLLSILLLSSFSGIEARRTTKFTNIFIPFNDAMKGHPYVNAIGACESKDDWNSIDNDLYDLKKSFRKKFTAMSSNQIMIKAAKEISKKYKIAVKEILKKETPDNNLKGDKTWDKEGNIK